MMAIVPIDAPPPCRTFGMLVSHNKRHVCASTLRNFDYLE